MKFFYENVFTRRAFLLLGIKGLLLSVLAARFYYLQVFQNTKYVLLSDKNRFQDYLIFPTRGRILDRTGAVLAYDKPLYSLYVLPQEVHSMATVLKKIKKYSPLDSDFRDYKTFLARHPFSAVRVASTESFKNFSHLNVHLGGLKGVYFEKDSKRTYPLGEVFSHVLGYTRPDLRVCVKRQQDEIFRAASFFPIGVSGLEKRYDSLLRGKEGYVRLEVGMRGEISREVVRKPAVAGQDLRLTVNAHLQRYGRAAMGKWRGCCIVMEVETGRICMMVSLPSFDGNLLSGAVSSERWNELQSSQDFSFFNKAVSGRYSPGSIFKLLVSYAALQKGLFPLNQTIECKGGIKVGGREFRCWQRQGHGVVGFHRGIVESCDVFFYELAKRLGIENMKEAVQRLGFGLPVKGDFLSSPSIPFPSNQWKRRTVGDPWWLSDTLNASIGQGYVRSTPLQLLVAMNVLISGGLKVEPLLLEKSLPKSERVLSASEEGIVKVLRRAMEGVVASKRGTARSAFEEQFPFAGKTGTVQLVSRKTGENLEGVLLPHQVAHGMFFGYAPLTKPKYCVLVVVEHGRSGGRIAAPIARNVLKEAIRLDEQGSMSHQEEEEEVV